MAERIGVCARCRTRFKVPGTFHGDKAKCKKCGGVVSVGAEIAPAKVDPPRTPSPRPQTKPPASRAPSLRPAAANPTREAPTSTPTPTAPSTSKPARPASPILAPATKAVRPASPVAPPSSILPGGPPPPAGNDLRFLLGLGGIAAVLIVGVAYFMIHRAEKDSLDEADDSALVARASEDPNVARNPTSSAPPPAKPVQSGESSPNDATEAPIPIEPIPVRPAPSPFLRLVAIPRPPGCTPAIWDSLQAPVKAVTSARANAEAKKRAFEQLRAEPLAGISSLLDAMNGLDLSKSDGFEICSRALRGIETISNGVVSAPFKFAANERLANLEFNVRAITMLAKSWSTALETPDAIALRIQDALKSRASSADDF